MAVAAAATGAGASQKADPTAAPPNADVAATASHGRGSAQDSSDGKAKAPNVKVEITKDRVQVGDIGHLNGHLDARGP